MTTWTKTLNGQKNGNIEIRSYCECGKRTCPQHWALFIAGTFTGTTAQTLDRAKTLARQYFAYEMAA